MRASSTLSPLAIASERASRNSFLPKSTPTRSRTDVPCSSGGHRWPARPSRNPAHGPQIRRGLHGPAAQERSTHPGSRWRELSMKSAPCRSRASTERRAWSGLPARTTTILGFSGPRPSTGDTGRENAGTDEATGFYVGPPASGAGEITAHIAHPKNTVREKGTKCGLFIPKMHMHVPEAGNQVLACSVDRTRPHFSRSTEIMRLP